MDKDESEDEAINELSEFTLFT